MSEPLSTAPKVSAGTFVRAQRVLHGLTQDRAQELLRFKGERLSDIERGAVIDLRLSELVALRDVLGVPFDVFERELLSSGEEAAAAAAPEENGAAPTAAGP